MAKAFRFTGVARASGFTGAAKAFRSTGVVKAFRFTRGQNSPGSGVKRQGEGGQEKQHTR